MNAHPERPARRAPWLTRVWASPLARGSDRAEAALVVGLVIVWLVTLPLIATIASAQWSSVESRVVDVQRSVTATDAVLLADAVVVMADPRSSAVVQPRADATWPDRNGRPTTGSIVVRAGAQAGDHQKIWLDVDGTVVDPPMTTQTAAGLLVLAAVGGWLLLGAVFLAFRRTVGWRFDRRRQRMWDDEWASFDAGTRSN